MVSKARITALHLAFPATSLYQPGRAAMGAALILTRGRGCGRHRPDGRSGVAAATPGAVPRWLNRKRSLLAHGDAVFHHAPIARGRCPFRTSDPALEPADA